MPGEESSHRGSKSEGSPKDYPSENDVSDVWKGIVGTQGTWNPSDAAIQKWRDELMNVECSNESLEINEKFRGVIKKIKSWRAPGPDCKKNFSG